LTAKSRAGVRTVRQERARARAADVAPILIELWVNGAESLRALAAGLEKRGIPTARGGKWSAAQVARVLEVADLAGPFRAGRRVKQRLSIAEQGRPIKRRGRP